MKNLGFLLLVATVVAADEFIKDMQRLCPTDFFYAGETTYRGLNTDKTKSYYYKKGEASPDYSCYSIISGELDWIKANKECEDKESQLISVNNEKEDLLLSRHQFWKMFKTQDGETLGDDDFDKIPNNVMTSGVDLGDQTWTWFGAGTPINKNITIDLPNPSTSGAQCLLLSWSKPNNTTRDNGSSEAEDEDDDDEKTSFTPVLIYSSVPCVTRKAETVAVCEVRVYVQTWYVWFYGNWLQLLFLFTLILLIISACLTLQVWIARPARRRPTPPITVADTATTNNKQYNKYMDKGKEILAKVVFYSPKKTEDKEKLTSTA
jgi:hypothetical protein